MNDGNPNIAADTGAANVIAHWKRQREADAAARGGTVIEPRVGELTLTLRGVTAITAVGSVGVAVGSVSAQAEGASIEAPPEVALAFALLDAGEKTDEGQLIVAVTPASVWIITELERDPTALYRLTPRQAEELVTGGWRAHAWQVTLTPRSADGGVDIIATRSDVGAIRILDQVKLYRPGRLVSAEDVRAMWGVLDADRRASKAYVTTTSAFAPGVYREFADRMPTRIELRDGAALREWLTVGHNRVALGD